MIEIVFDKNQNDIFLGEERPVYKLEASNIKTWDTYRKQARIILEKYKNDQFIIVRNQGSDTSTNWLAVALFIESCLSDTNLEAVVFKVENHEEAISAYKPFVALTIGLKYILRIYQEDWKTIYKEISCLSYLGLTIDKDYSNNKLIVKLLRRKEPQKMSSSTLDKALEIIGIMKTLALSSLPISIEAELGMKEERQTPDINQIIKNVVEYVKPLID